MSGFFSFFANPLLPTCLRQGGVYMDLFHQSSLPSFVSKLRRLSPISLPHFAHSFQKSNRSRSRTFSHFAHLTQNSGGSSLLTCLISLIHFQTAVAHAYLLDTTRLIWGRNLVIIAECSCLLRILALTGIRQKTRPIGQ